MFILRASRSAALAAGLALLFVACRSSEPSRDVDYLVRRGQYGAALRKAERLADERPESREAQEVYAEARVAYMLDQARQALFDEEPEEALAILERAEAERPGHPMVELWTAKVRSQLAEEWLDRANDHLASGQLDLAGAAFERSLGYDPSNIQTRLGLSRVLFMQNYRAGQSRSYYTQGVTAFRELLLPEADNSLAKSLHYDDDNEEARARREQVRLVMIEDRMASARALEEAGLYPAARNEYRLALLLDEGNEEAADGLDRMDREVRALTVLDAVDMDFRRGDFQNAEAALAQADIISERQDDDVRAMRGQMEDARLRGMYERALGLERDYKYEEAVVAYGELLAQADHYEDAISRKAYLEEFIQRAHELYAEFLETESDAERLALLREIELSWPEFKDVPDRIRSYEARAQELYEQAMRADPEQVKAFLEEIRRFYPDYKDVTQRLAELGRPKVESPAPQPGEEGPAPKEEGTPDDGAEPRR